MKLILFSGILFSMRIQKDIDIPWNRVASKQVLMEHPLTSTGEVLKAEPISLQYVKLANGLRYAEAIYTKTGERVIIEPNFFLPAPEEDIFRTKPENCIHLGNGFYLSSLRISDGSQEVRGTKDLMHSSLVINSYMTSDVDPATTDDEIERYEGTGLVVIFNKAKKDNPILIPNHNFMYEADPIRNKFVGTYTYEEGIERTSIRFEQEIDSKNSVSDPCLICEITVVDEKARNEAKFTFDKEGFLSGIQMTGPSLLDSPKAVLEMLAPTTASQRGTIYFYGTDLYSLEVQRIVSKLLGVDQHKLLLLQIDKSATLQAIFSNLETKTPVNPRQVLQFKHAIPSKDFQKEL